MLGPSKPRLSLAEAALERPEMQELQQQLRASGLWRRVAEACLWSVEQPAEGYRLRDPESIVPTGTGTGKQELEIALFGTPKECPRKMTH